MPPRLPLPAGAEPAAVDPQRMNDRGVDLNRNFPSPN
jgi:murein tripeptide amidase MpaA